MAITMTAAASHEQKRQWLLRPIHLAYDVCVFASIFDSGLWYLAEVDHTQALAIGALTAGSPEQTIAAIAIGSLIVAAALVLWGVRRITLVVQPYA